MLVLPELQSAFRAAVLDGKSRGLLREIDGNRIGAAGALAIYRNHVRISLTAALRTTFPVVCKLVDERFFAFAAHAYIQAVPPETPCLAEYGASFPGFLASFAPCRGVPYLADVARLEWALNCARIARYGAPLDHLALAKVAPAELPNLTFGFDPAVRLLASSYPIDRIWLANQEPPQAGAVELAGDSRLQIYRARSEAVFRTLEPASFLFRKALQRRVALGDAAETALAADPMFDLMLELSQMIREGVISGFTITEEKETQP
jgi:hypothetical protein